VYQCCYCDYQEDFMALTYEGPNCKICGTTEKYCWNKACVQCKRDGNRRRKAEKDRLNAEKVAAGDLPDRFSSRHYDRIARSAARGRGDHQYRGRTCKKCGSNIRYTNRGICVECVARKNEKFNAINRPSKSPAKPESKRQTEMVSEAADDAMRALISVAKGL